MGRSSLKSKRIVKITVAGLGKTFRGECKQVEIYTRIYIYIFICIYIECVCVWEN